ncbi:unnamed protein product, partial [Rotaria sp. Silwood1]
VVLFNLKMQSSAMSKDFPLYEFINEVAGDIDRNTSVEDVTVSAMTIEF